MTDPRRAIEDELLVLACQDGRGQAFRDLVQRWHAPLWRHARRLTGDADVAADVVQDTWLAVARGLHGLRDAAGFRRWVYTIATRRAADHARRRPPTADGDLDAAAAPAGPEPSDAVVALRAALRRLPAEQRALLALRYDEDFDLRDIAAVLGVPEGTVKSRLHHARENLRGLLDRMQP